MYILDVIPIAKNVGASTLSYFSTKKIQAGAMVTIPVRSSKISALVISVHDVRDRKSELKSASFQLKSIISHDGYTSLPEWYIDAIGATMISCVTPAGMLIASLTAKPLLDRLLSHVTKTARPATRTADQSNLKSERFAFARSLRERLAYYKTYIRQEFAFGRSVIVVCPTLRMISILHTLLYRGIENRVVILHSSLTKKQHDEAFSLIEKSGPPLVILMTPSYIGLPRNDIGTILVEEEHSPFYYRDNRPRLDTRSFLENVAIALGARLIFADTCLRISTVWRAEHGELRELQPLSLRLGYTASLQIVDMRKNSQKNKISFQESSASENMSSIACQDTHKIKKAYSLFSPELMRAISQSRIQNKKICLLTTRTGYAPLTICNDCSTVLRCPSCDIPLILHQGKKDTRTYLCHRCQYSSPSSNECQECGSWRLSLVGTGIERIAEELRATSPSTNIYTVSQEATPRSKDIDLVLKNFYSDPHGLLLGTSKLIPYIDTTIDIVGVVSFDSLLALPHYTIGENVLGSCIHLLDNVQNALIIQTRYPDDVILKTLASRRLREYIDGELRDRQSFGYPPSMTLIRISVITTKESKEEKLRMLYELFGSYDPDMYLGPSKDKQKKTLYTLMRISPDAWRREVKNHTESHLVNSLRSLSMSYEIEINPPHIV